MAAAYSIGDDGIRLGEMLPEQEGLLGGRPTRKRPPDPPASSADAEGA